MDESTHPRALTAPDLLTLAGASMTTLIAEMERWAPTDAAPEGVPDRTVQVADFILAEAVRLIRLGTRSELTDASVRLTQLLIRPIADTLEQKSPDAFQTLMAASSALSVAASPASKGGELAVLRCWRGKALEIVRRVNAADGHAIQRAELRDELGLKDSYLSHLLADAEAAGLVERIRHGRTVTVHLGPRGYAPHVQELLGRRPESTAERNAAIVREALERIADEVEHGAPFDATDADGLREYRQRLVQLRRLAERFHARLEQPIAQDDLVYCRIYLSAFWTDLRLDPWKTELLLHARVEHGRIAEARLWSDAEEWAQIPVPTSAEAAAPGTEDPDDAPAWRHDVFPWLQEAEIDSLRYDLIEIGGNESEPQQLPNRTGTIVFRPQLAQSLTRLAPTDPPPRRLGGASRALH